MATHRYSGWPGAWCLDCGMEDLDELGVALEQIYFDFDEAGNPTGSFYADEGLGIWRMVLQICLEPGSNRFNPYSHRPTPEMSEPYLAGLI